MELLGFLSQAVPAAPGVRSSPSLSSSARVLPAAAAAPGLAREAPLPSGHSLGAAGAEPT